MFCIVGHHHAGKSSLPEGPDSVPGVAECYAVEHSHQFGHGTWQRGVVQVNSLPVGPQVLQWNQQGARQVTPRVTDQTH